MQPGVLVRGELVGPGDDVVARLPGKALGHQIDAGRGVADQGDFLGQGADHAGGQGPQVLDRGGSRRGSWPTRWRWRPRPSGSGPSWAGPLNGRHGGMVEIGPLPGDRHLAAKSVPIGGVTAASTGFAATGHCYLEICSGDSGELSGTEDQLYWKLRRRTISGRDLDAKSPVSGREPSLPCCCCWCLDSIWPSDSRSTGSV